jgi:hypothetical protein
MYDDPENEPKSKKVKNEVQPENRKKNKHLICGTFSIPIESS